MDAAEVVPHEVNGNGGYLVRHVASDLHAMLQMPCGGRDVGGGFPRPFAPSKGVALFIDTLLAGR